jgi:diacylglycerol kinase
MNSGKPFSFRERVGNFQHAFRGLFDMLRTEHNAWIHAVMTIVVLILSWWVRLDAVRFSLIVLAIVTVWAAEALNTTSEIIVDMASPEISPIAKRAKDISAAAVLIAVIGSCVLFFIILFPEIVSHLSAKS